MAIDFADLDRVRGGLVRTLEETVKSLESPWVGFWGKSHVVDDAGVYGFIDETKTKPAPGGKLGCAPDLLVVSGHGVEGRLADSSVIGRWRLSEVAAAIVQRLPCVQVIVFALCNTNADMKIARELSGITRNGGPMIIGIQGSIATTDRDSLVQRMVNATAACRPPNGSGPPSRGSSRASASSCASDHPAHARAAAACGFWCIWG
jgi:hypothetical protein